MKKSHGMKKRLVKGMPKRMTRKAPTPKQRAELKRERATQTRRRG